MLHVWAGRFRRGGPVVRPSRGRQRPRWRLQQLSCPHRSRRWCRRPACVPPRRNSGPCHESSHDGRKERSCWPTAGVGEPISSATLHVMRRTEVHDDNPRIRQLLWQGFGQAQAVLVLQDHSEKDHLYIVVRSESPASPSLLTGFEESAGSSTPACFIRSAGTERAGPTTCTAWPRFHRRSPTCRSSRCRGSTVPSSSRECFRSRAGSHFPPGCDPLRRT